MKLKIGCGWTDPCKSIAKFIVQSIYAFNSGLNSSFGEVRGEFSVTTTRNFVVSVRRCFFYLLVLRIMP